MSLAPHSLNIILFLVFKMGKFEHFVDVIEVPPLPSLTPPFFFFCCSSSARWSHFGAAAGWRFRLSRLRRNGGVCLRVCSPHFSPPPQTPSPPLSRKFWRRRHQISEQPKFKWAVTEAMTMYHKERNIWMELSLLDLSPDHCSPLMPLFLHSHFHFLSSPSPSPMI